MKGFKTVEVFSLKAMRENHPTWSWFAERSGFGWCYVGLQGGKTVRVTKVASFADEDGELPPDIRVYGAGKGELYATWSRAAKKQAFLEGAEDDE